MSQSYTGGCACGAVRYEVLGEPILMVDCQCRQCQRESGTGNSSSLTFQAAEVKLHGEAQHWDFVGDSGIAKSRGFCPHCGSPVYITFPQMPDVFNVRVGSLDNPERYKPEMAFWTSTGYAWDHLDPAIPKLREMPPG